MQDACLYSHLLGRPKQDDPKFQTILGNFNENLSQNLKKKKKIKIGWGYSSLRVCLPSMHKDLSSNPSNEYKSV